MKPTYSLMALMTATIICGSFFLPGCEQATTTRTSTEEQVDQKLVEQVTTALVNSPSFKFPDVQVTSYKGRVQLSGFVKSDDQKSAAEAMAKRIPGVVEVENGISLKQ